MSRGDTTPPSWEDRETGVEDQNATDERERLIDETVMEIIEAVRLRLFGESRELSEEELRKEFLVQRAYSLEKEVEEITISFSLPNQTWREAEGELREIAKEKMSERFSISFEEVRDEPAEKSIIHDQTVDIICRIEYRAPEELIHR